MEQATAGLSLFGPPEREHSAVTTTVPQSPGARGLPSPSPFPIANSDGPDESRKLSADLFLEVSGSLFSADEGEVDGVAKEDWESPGAVNLASNEGSVEGFCGSPGALIFGGDMDLSPLLREPLAQGIFSTEPGEAITSAITRSVDGAVRCNDMLLHPASATELSRIPSFFVPRHLKRMGVVHFWNMGLIFVFSFIRLAVNGSHNDEVHAVGVVGSSMGMLGAHLMHPGMISSGILLLLGVVVADVWFTLTVKDPDRGDYLVAAGPVVFLFGAWRLAVELLWVLKWFHFDRLEEMCMKAVGPQDRGDYLSHVTPPRLRVDNISYVQVKNPANVVCVAACGDFSVAGTSHRVRVGAEDGAMNASSELSAVFESLPEARRLKRVRSLGRRSSSISRMSESEHPGNDDDGGVATDNGSVAVVARDAAGSSPVPIIQNTFLSSLSVESVQASTTVAECGCNTRVGCATAGLHRKLYSLGGHPDRYRLDIFLHDRKEWTSAKTTGDAPPPLFFASVCCVTPLEVWDAVAQCVVQQTGKLQPAAGGGNRGLLGGLASPLRKSSMARGLVDGDDDDDDSDDDREFNRQHTPSAARPVIRTARPTLRGAFIDPWARSRLDDVSSRGSAPGYEFRNVVDYNSESASLVMYGGVIPRDGCSPCVFCIGFYGITGAFPRCLCCVPYDGVHILQLRSMKWTCVVMPRRTYTARVLRHLSDAVPSMRSLFRICPRGRQHVPDASSQYHKSVAVYPMPRIASFMGSAMGPAMAMGRGKGKLAVEEEEFAASCSGRIVVYGGVGWRDVGSDGAIDRLADAPEDRPLSRRWAMFDDIWVLNLGSGQWKRRSYRGNGPACSGYRTGVAAASHLISRCTPVEDGDGDRNGAVESVYRVGRCVYVMHSLPMNIGGFSVCSTPSSSYRDVDPEVICGSAEDVSLSEVDESCSDEQGWVSTGHRAGRLVADRATHLGGGVALWRFDIISFRWTLVPLASTMGQPRLVEASEEEGGVLAAVARALRVGGAHGLRTESGARDGTIRPKLLALPPTGGMCYGDLPSGEPMISCIGGWLDVDIVPAICKLLCRDLYTGLGAGDVYNSFSHCRVCSGHLAAPAAGMHMLRCCSLLSSSVYVSFLPESTVGACDIVLDDASMVGVAGKSTHVRDCRMDGVEAGVDPGPIIERWGYRVPHVTCFEARQDTEDGVPLVVIFPPLFCGVSAYAVEGSMSVYFGGIDRVAFAPARVDEVQEGLLRPSRRTNIKPPAPVWWNDSRVGTLPVGSSCIMNGFPVHCFSRHLLWRYSFIQRPLSADDDQLFLQTAEKTYLSEGSVEQMEEMEELPEPFLCPIGFGVMRQPVVAMDGYSYDRADIYRWFTGKRTSPSTNESMDAFPLHRSVLIPNMSLRRAIRRFRLGMEMDPLIGGAAPEAPEEEASVESALLSADAVSIAPGDTPEG